MSNGFLWAFNWILSVECPKSGSCFSDHPTDPGGATNWGITHTEWEKYLVRNSLPPKDIRSVTHEDAADFYREIWEGDIVSQVHDVAGSRMALIVFDAIVNTGPNTAVICLQRTIETLVDRHQWNNCTDLMAIDGKFGPNTRQVLFEWCQTFAVPLIEEQFLWERIEHYRKIAKSWTAAGKIRAAATWLPVWVNRMFRLHEVISND